MITGTTSSPTNGWLSTFFHAFGASNQRAQLIQSVIAKPLVILLILVVTWVISRLGKKIIQKFVSSLLKHSQASRAETLSRRVATLGLTIAHLFSAVIWFIGTLTALGVLGLNLTPLLTGATVIGATLAFGAQNVVKDYLSGVFLITEDQFGIGDTISVLDTTGVVEAVSLRSTVIRGNDGIRWHISNGDIRKLGNLSQKNEAKATSD
ncbi:MAG: mechanosensitive ion channel [Acidimicrobiales bacterium]|nr:mechanosensitive ion channel [Acidimicrobiales bacterium]